jgi:aminocarboxymuconate-semialdehyde decarboxylase
VTLGSDYCFDMGLEDPRRGVERLQLTTKEKGLIAGGNAARLLRL